MELVFSFTQAIDIESFSGLFLLHLQIAISASNTGGAWDNAKKYIEVKKTIFMRKVIFVFAKYIYIEVKKKKTPYSMTYIG